MEELISLIESGKFVKGSFKDKEDFFKIVSDKLFREDYVSEKFLEKILDREIVYPTGLKINNIGISIPHCDSEYIYKNGILIAIFDNPIQFNRMDAPEKLVDVNISFVLLIKDKETHLLALQQLIIFIQSQQFDNLIKAESQEDVLKLIRG